jgi:hypothetical protein
LRVDISLAQQYCASKVRLKRKLLNSVRPIVMTESVTTKRSVIVAGDVIVDWNFAITRQDSEKLSAWSTTERTHGHRQFGGSAAVYTLLGAIVGQVQDEQGPLYSVHSLDYRDEEVRPGDPRFNHAYLLWSRYATSIKPQNTLPVWRLRQSLGVDLIRTTPVRTNQPVDLGQTILLVLIDGGLRFGNNRALWPSILDESPATPPWILLKLGHPVASSELWRHLRAKFSDRLITVTTVDDLRKRNFAIRGLCSWEMAAEELVKALEQEAVGQDLIMSRYLIVSLHTAGALLVSRSPASNDPSSSAMEYSLIYDPNCLEHAWEQDYPGHMAGYTTCLTASVAYSILRDPENPDLRHALRSGVHAIRALHKTGYVDAQNEEPYPRLVFPVESIVQAISSPSNSTFSTLELPNPFVERWTILRDTKSINIRGLEDLAVEVATKGPHKGLRDVPMAQFGELITIDRREIEAYHNIRSLLQNYLDQRFHTKPLSIAVFGTPGSGKSFGIVQIARSLNGGKITHLTFNLSQFDKLDNLWEAFHRVRDVGLSGKVPLVFWDEFDTTFNGAELGWLRYFLAPMDDGAFTQGQFVHPIGPALFVFADSTKKNIDEFSKYVQKKDLKGSKAVDFASRLVGYIDVIGPNSEDDPVHNADFASRLVGYIDVIGRNSDDDPVHNAEVRKDPYYIVRRAILLRAILQRTAPQLFTNSDAGEVLNIDPGVLHAFLTVKTYKHGARSMEAIVSMSHLSDKRSFLRSDLPAEGQLSLHVDGFLALVG